eukprot:7644016-Lingulodinium_polyedra.AAC.1
MPGPGGRRPPSRDLVAAPLYRYAREWWLATAAGAIHRPVALDPKELCQAFEAGRRLAGSRGRRRAAHSPVALAIAV